MVNFRFHLVSLTAVFLALAAGITIGAGVVDRATVDQIERQLADVAERRRETNAENDRLRAELSTDTRFLEEAGDQLVAGELAGAPIILVATTGVDRGLVERFRATLAAAGAEVDGTYWFTGEWALAEPGGAREVAAILDVAPTTSAANVRAAALGAVGASWAAGDSGPIVGALIEAGYIEFEAAPVELVPAPQLPRPETTFVVISSAAAEVAPEELGVPLATRLAAEGLPVLAAGPTDPVAVAPAAGEESESDTPSFVALLRDSDAEGQLSTVDNLDDPRGGDAAVLAVRDLRSGARGHYGFGPDVRLVPEPPPGVTTTAIVPAKDRADRIGATVEALLGLPAVDDVVVVDDGSTDATAEHATAAGATVVRLHRNRGKGGAVAAGLAAAPDADIYLLIDADLGATAGLAETLLGPVVDGTADMTIGVLPSAGRKGGFGSIRRGAAAGIRRASGFEARAPLSGQRAVRGDLLRSVALAPRFGLEVGLTIDVIRAGGRVVEVDVAMDHRHTGRRLSGFRHRAGQGVDIARALWPRLTTARFRVALIAAAFLAASIGALLSGSGAEPESRRGPTGASRVVVFGMPGLSWDDVGTGRLPHLDRAIDRGAISATSVRTLSGRPNTTEGYATLGAGTRVAARDIGGFAFDADSVLEGGSAAQALERRTGLPVDGEVAVVGGPATRKLNEGRHLTSAPGALAEALHRAGKRTAVIGNADTGYPLGERASILRPAAIAMMDAGGSVDVGEVSRDLLQPDPAAPFGYTANDRAILAAFDRAIEEADVVLVDPGEIDRAAEFTAVASGAVADDVRRRALRETDELLGDVVSRLPDDALLVIVSVVPPDSEWHLTPTVIAGDGVPSGYLHSPSTRRPGVVTLTDIAPTILAALDVPVPSGMIGHPLRYRPGEVELDRFHTLDRDAAYREGIYLPITLTYITLQAVLYLLAIVAFARLGGAGRLGPPLRIAVLCVAAYPVASFLFRAIPDVAELGTAGVLVLLAVIAAVVALASRARRHPLSPLAWILGLTVAVLALDVATGARLQTSSLLGYSLHTAARFTGFGNTAFATLASTTVLLGAIHVAFAPRRREAVFSVACLFAFAVIIDGAPSLGSDVGGILTLVPVFGLTLLVLSGRRLTTRAVVTAAAVTLVALALATGIDLLRPASTRTHLGRLVGDIGSDGFGAFSTTVQRKLAVNFRTYRSPWSWTVVIIAFYMLYVLGWARGWRHLLPPGSALRAGVVGTLAAGLLGYAVNDSGVVVTAVVFVYLGPFLTMLALHRERTDGADEPEVVEAAPA